MLGADGLGLLFKFQFYDCFFYLRYNTCYTLYHFIIGESNYFYTVVFQLVTSTRIIFSLRIMNGTINFYYQF